MLNLKDFNFRLDFANFDESFEESNIRKFLSEDEDSEVNSASEPETQT